MNLTTFFIIVLILGVIGFAISAVLAVIAHFNAKFHCTSLSELTIETMTSCLFVMIFSSLGLYLS